MIEWNPPSASTGSPVSVSVRVAAKVLDLAIVFVLAAAVLYPIGPLLALAYSLLADGMPFFGSAGQSVGKRFCQIQVISQLDGKPVGYRQSFFRNIPVGVATVFALIPLWGWIILVLVGVPLMAMEIYLMKKTGGGHRLGDAFGDTEVRRVR